MEQQMVLDLGIILVNKKIYIYIYIYNTYIDINNCITEKHKKKKNL